MNTLESILLFKEPSILKIGQALETISSEWRIVAFQASILVEFLGKWNFADVIKRLIISLLFIGSFETIHIKATDFSLSSASQLIKTFQPDNMFLKDTHAKKAITKKEKSNWIPGFIEDQLPDWNNMIATVLYVCARIFMFGIKLIYSTVYYFTSIFSSFAAILFLFGWTQGALKGTVLTSVWCLILPYFIAVAMILTGGAMHQQAMSGETIDLDKALWLFGITLLIISMPIAAYKFISGEGIQSFGAGVASLMMTSVPKLAMMGALLKKGSIAPRAAIGGGGGILRNLFTEPSGSDLMKREMSEKQRLFNKRNLRIPFKSKTDVSLDGKLEELGISKEEVKALTSSTPKNGKAANGSGFQGLEKETYLHNENFWNKISPQHRGAIMRKYGIEGDKPQANQLYHPIKSGLPSKAVGPKSTHTRLIEAELHERAKIREQNTPKKTNSIPKRNRGVKSGNIRRLSK